MHNKVNKLKVAQDQISAILASVKKTPETQEIISAGKNLLEKLTTWDEKMVQRKSKAYDDVENFENKFTAEYLFLINQTDSDIPRVNKASVERRNELESEWKELNNEAENLLNNAIPEFNKKLWSNGIGAIKL